MIDQPDNETADTLDQQNSPDFFDESVILNQTEGDREFAKELAQTFLDSSKPILTEMEEAFARGDAESLRSGAHNIKGSAGNFGSPGAQNAAYELELTAEQNDMLGAGEKLETLKQKIAVLACELQKFINES